MTPLLPMGRVPKSVPVHAALTRGADLAEAEWVLPPLACLGMSGALLPLVPRQSQTHTPGECSG
ncbi:hypothetical protein [Hoeflea alexandrii]|uniref:hypothetical protein n=1 Tax=Hoeflea alexandrii TaxID=288436 RepID=UPI00226F1528|nr:hypothetical protein [Hoeflea alexandrii]MCY0151871.1 hypothetical protein [Hoeflea alexandrii]